MASVFWSVIVRAQRVRDYIPIMKYKFYSSPVIIRWKEQHILLMLHAVAYQAWKHSVLLPIPEVSTLLPELFYWRVLKVPGILPDCCQIVLKWKHSPGGRALRPPRPRSDVHISDAGCPFNDALLQLVSTSPSLLTSLLPTWSLHSWAGKQTASIVRPKVGKIPALFIPSLTNKEGS